MILIMQRSVFSLSWVTSSFPIQVECYLINTTIIIETIQTASFIVNSQTDATVDVSFEIYFVALFSMINVIHMFKHNYLYLRSKIIIFTIIEILL